MGIYCSFFLGMIIWSSNWISLGMRVIIQFVTWMRFTLTCFNVNMAMKNIYKSGMVPCRVWLSKGNHGFLRILKKSGDVGWNFPPLRTAPRWCEGPRFVRGEGKHGLHLRAAPWFFFHNIHQQKIGDITMMVTRLGHPNNFTRKDAPRSSKWIAPTLVNSQCLFRGRIWCDSDSNPLTCQDAAPHEKKSSEILKYPFATFPQNICLGKLLGSWKIPFCHEQQLGSLCPEVWWQVKYGVPSCGRIDSCTTSVHLEKMP